MKKYLLLILIPLAGFLLSSCDSTSNTTSPPTITTGSIFIQSTPTGASIALNGSSTSKVTPDSLTDLNEDTYNVTLSKTGYKDTTFSATVNAGFQTVKSITLTSDLTYSTYMDTIWETSHGTTADQPSGIDLSSGMAISSTKADIDIYYYSTSDYSTIEIRSGDLSGNTTRKTAFFVPQTGTNLFDGVSSPLAVPNWDNKMGDRESNYVFLFDTDSHYSKLKIVGYGGATQQDPGPAYVIVQWIYNKKANDQRFPTQP